MNLPAEDEFNKIQKKDYEKNHTNLQGRKQAGKGVNVDENVLPYDANRVVLMNKINSSDYINASWITRRKEQGNYDLLRPFLYQPFDEVSFIASQGPVPKTYSAYYEMIHQEKLIIGI